MSIILTDQEDKTHQRNCTIIRLILLLLQIFILLNNRNDQTGMILSLFPEINSSESAEFKSIDHSYAAANTMGLVFAIMQLLILYVGTNRFRVKPTIFSAIMHMIGSYLYWSQTTWQFEHIWEIYYVFSFIPLGAEIGVSLFTARG